MWDGSPSRVVGGIVNRPLHDQDAEEAVVGAILAGGVEILRRVVDVGVTADSFYRPSLGTIFRTMMEIAALPRTRPSRMLGVG